MTAEAQGASPPAPGGAPAGTEVVTGPRAAGLLARAVARFPQEISYVRVEVGRPPLPTAAPGTVPSDRDWLACGELVADPDWLVALIDHSGRALGAPGRAVAASLFVQNYAYRVLMSAVACATTSGVVPDGAAPRLALTVTKGRPHIVRYVEARVLVRCGAAAEEGERPPGWASDPAGAEAAVDFLLGQAVGAHLAHLVGATRAGCRVGGRLLWGNVAASAAVAFRTMEGCLGPWVRPLGERFFERAPAELQGLGSFLALERDGRRGWYWERRNCCLYDRLPGNRRCADCSRTPAAERRAAYLSSLGDRALPPDRARQRP